MPISDRRRNHLSAILNSDAIRPSGEAFSATAIQSFMDSIAVERIRLHRTDWQGHGVLDLLWHFDDLKPAGQQRLSQFILDQWHCRHASTEAPASSRRQYPDGSEAVPSLAESMNQSACEEKRASNTNDARPSPKGTPSSTDCFAALDSDGSAAAAPRRDWFDRFTDWVAAVLALLD